MNGLEENIDIKEIPIVNWKGKQLCSEIPKGIFIAMSAYI